jgi:hypothetical protein
VKVPALSPPVSFIRIFFVPGRNAAVLTTALEPQSSTSEAGPGTPLKAANFFCGEPETNFMLTLHSEFSMTISEFVLIETVTSSDSAFEQSKVDPIAA